MPVIFDEDCFNTSLVLLKHVIFGIVQPVLDKASTPVWFF